MVRIIPSRLKPYTGATNCPASPGQAASPVRGNGASASPERLRDSGLMLHIVILKARDLAAKDRGGTSDPYLVLNLGEARHVTHAVSKTLNPEWNEICQMPVNRVEHLLLDVCCWDKDRFGKEYLGEFDLALEEIFANEKTEQAPVWFPLKSKRPGKKTGVVSGQVLLQFTLLDSHNREASPQQVLDKLSTVVKAAPEAEASSSSSRHPTPTLTPVLSPSKGPTKEDPGATSPALHRRQAEGDDDEFDVYDDETPEDEDPTKPESVEKRRRRLRIKGLRRKKRDNPYEFTNAGGDVVGIIFLEIINITDLPPESNFTKTSFDMDPFVVASLGKKTFRTKVIRHNLNPVYNEKMIFQVMGHEQSYSFAFTVIDRDKYSGNDFIASASLAIKGLIDGAPKANPDNGLYDLRDPPEFVPQQRSRLRRLGISRSSSATSISKMAGKPPAMSKNGSAASSPAGPPPASAPTSATTTAPMPIPTTTSQPAGDGAAALDAVVARSPNPSPGLLVPLSDMAMAGAAAGAGEQPITDGDGPDFTMFALPLKMKNLDKWEDKHNPTMFLRAKYMPYPALRQQFWRAMLKQYDTDESGCISQVELTTMLDSLGSTLRESTIDGFFRRFEHRDGGEGDDADLTMDEAVICLEEQLDAKPRQPPQGAAGERLKNMVADGDRVVKDQMMPAVRGQDDPSPPAPPFLILETSSVSESTLAVPEPSSAGEEGELLERDDLNDRGEEHVVEIRECPICHQPRLDKRKDADIITHIATCASQDWRQVNSLMMAGFVTASQAQRKWYSKVITKISYGGYRLGANSANILVQDRITGQISEEKMSVYVRLGIRLLYKGLRSNNMENKRIRVLLKGLSIKQGRKFDDPASKSEIRKFIEFHRLDMSEVRRGVDEFRNFNEFFYRELKPGARPCSAPDSSHIIVSPADCRSVVFNRVDTATKIWVKGRGFSIKRLLGNAYPEDVRRYEAGGGLGIFRLAPQDYHRFHIPVDGVLRKPKLIAGEYYTVNPMAIRSALDVYGENVRVVVPIDSVEHGRVMCVCVGAMMVGSTVITRQEGEEVKRAEELGYFKFGGSTIVLLFEEGRMVFDDDLVDNSNGALETLIRAGMSVGHSPHKPAHTPDMRKDEKEVTEEEKREAKRRIQGSASAEDSPEDSGGDDLLPPAATSAVAR